MNKNDIVRYQYNEFQVRTGVILEIKEERAQVQWFAKTWAHGEVENMNLKTWVAVGKLTA